MLIGPPVTVRGRTKFPREAVQDGENMKLIAEAASQQVKMVSNGAIGCVFFGGGQGMKARMYDALRVTVSTKVTGVSGV